MQKLLRKTSGFTLIELLIALVLVGMLMGLVVGQVGKIFQREMKQSASHLATTIRFLYNKSVSDGVLLRLVMDLGENRYWVESSTDASTIQKEGEEINSAEKKSEEESGKSDSSALEPKEASFSPEESFLLKPVQLPKGVFFKDVYAEHQYAPVSDGKAFLYFFPQGYAEHAVIHLRDTKDENHFSLEVNPVTGGVKIEKGYKEVEVGGS